MTKYANILKTDSLNPLIEHVHKANAAAKLMNVKVDVNSDSFRDKEYEIEKKNKYRIIFLGDSITFGWGVEKEETFEENLEQEINKLYPAEILNFGTGNYNTQQEVNLFIEKGLKYDPDKVVVFYFINDAEITPKKSNYSFLGYSYLVTFYWSKIRAVVNLSNANNYKTYYANLYRDDQEGWLRTKQAFLQLKKICREKNIKLQVVLLPELHDLKDYPFRKEHEKIISYLKSNQIESLDLGPLFSDWADPKLLWVAKDDAHPNKLGHKLIAQYSLNFILQKGKNEN